MCAPDPYLSLSLLFTVCPISGRVRWCGGVVADEALPRRCFLPEMRPVCRGDSFPLDLSRLLHFFPVILYWFSRIFVAVAVGFTRCRYIEDLLCQHTPFPTPPPGIAVAALLLPLAAGNKRNNKPGICSGTTRDGRFNAAANDGFPNECQVWQVASQQNPAAELLKRIRVDDSQRLMVAQFNKTVVHDVCGRTV